MNAPRDLSSRRVRTATGLHRALTASGLAGVIDNGVGLGDVGSRPLEGSPFAPQRLSLRTAVLVGLLVPLELAARQRFVIALGLVPQGHMRFDLLLLDHPPQYLSGAVIHITDQSLRLESKALLNPLNHGSGGVDFIGLVGGRGFNIDHNSGR